MRGATSHRETSSWWSTARVAGIGGCPTGFWPAVLAPSVYCLRVDGAQAKASVVTARESPIALTGTGVPYFHPAGRLSKRVALVWWRDAAARQRIVDAAMV